MEIKRKERNIKIGNIIIGKDYPIAVQTMWKKPLNEIDDKLISDINKFQKLGCDILRFAVPDLDTAKVLGELSSKVEMPLVADIHFDYKLALKCLDYNIAKIRINPGNIGAKWKVEEVIKKASNNNIPIRVGVNSGSLPSKLRNEKDLAAAMLKAAEDEMNILVKNNFQNMLFSLKASSINETVKSNILFSEKYDYPLHLGVTEAGPMIPGIVKSSIALAGLIKKGIGSTIRVSLSDLPEKEIITAKEIISAVDNNTKGVKIVSCPRCGRSGFDVHGFLDELGDFIYSLDKDISIAVMGCVVNGPGESKHADIGITGAGNSVIIFKKGKILKKIDSSDAVRVFKEEIEKL